MTTPILPRDQWVAQAAQCLAKIYGETEPNEHLKNWAYAIAVTYYDEIIADGDAPYSPQDAVDEDLSYLF